MHSPHLRTAAPRALIAFLAVAAMAGGAYRTSVHVDQFLLSRGGVEMAWGLFMTVLLGIGPLAAGLLSLLLLLRVWHLPDARVLALFLAALAYALGGDGYWMALSRAGAPVGLLLAVDTLLPVAIITALACITRFSAVFPRPLTRQDLATAPRGPLAAAVHAGQRWTLRPRAVTAAAAGLVGGIVIPVQIFHFVLKSRGSDVSIMGPVKILMIGILLSGMVVAAANLRSGYRLADAEGRRRVYWIAEGFLAATAILAAASAAWVVERLGWIAMPLPYWYSVAAVLAFVALLACIAVAMFAAGALDPSLAIKRTAAAGMAGAAMVLLFALMEQVVQELLVEWMGMSDRAGGVLTGASVALLFEPVRKRSTALAARLLRRDSAPAADAAVAAVASTGGEPAGA
jgi:hypothetical protein